MPKIISIHREVVKSYWNAEDTYGAISREDNRIHSIIWGFHMGPEEYSRILPDPQLPIFLSFIIRIDSYQIHTTHIYIHQYQTF